jgi:hypothetical protein
MSPSQFGKTPISIAQENSMTAQSPERIILDGRPRELFADPLYKLCEEHQLGLHTPYSFSTGNYRGYVGTWEIRDRRLYLTYLGWDGMDRETGYYERPISDEVRRDLLRAASASDFPIHAHWFSGKLRIPIGRRLIYSHHGWSSWYERERVIHVRAGEVVRDREVDTRAILEWWRRRNKRL